MPTHVRIQGNGGTTVDGAPFYLIGARHMPDGGTPEALRDAGFNAYRYLPFGTEGMGPEALPGHFDGIYFWDYLFDRAVLDRNPGYDKELRTHVKEISRHPGLLCYENYNEVTMRRTRDGYKCTPEELARGTRIVRQLDPRHPIWMCYHCSNTVDALREFNPCADAFGCNPYPVYGSDVTDLHVCRPDGRILDCIDQSIHAVGKYTEKMRQVTRDRRPVWMLVQAVANENWGDDKRWERKNPVFPTFEQMRFMAWDDIASGARGLGFSLRRTPASGRIWDDIVRVVRELSELHDVLASTPVPRPVAMRYTDLGYSIWDGVRATLRRTRAGVHLFAVNTAADPAEVTMRIPLACRGPASVLGEERELPVRRDTLHDRFEGFGVHLYRMAAA